MEGRYLDFVVRVSKLLHSDRDLIRSMNSVLVMLNEYFSIRNPLLFFRDSVTLSYSIELAPELTEEEKHLWNKKNPVASRNLSREMILYPKERNVLDLPLSKGLEDDYLGTMVYPVMGKEMGLKFLPYFLGVFFFIVFMNLMGLVPGSVTPTASIFVTLGLALTTFMMMLGCGMVAQGPIAFWKNLVPHVPLALWPLMFVVEIIGLVIKPFALMIRLFANMTAGHTLVLSLLGIIFLFANLTIGKFVIAGASLSMVLAVMLLEVFVAFLQAYIFAMLTTVFIGLIRHAH